MTNAADTLIAAGLFDGCSCGVRYDEDLRPLCRSCDQPWLLPMQRVLRGERLECHVCQGCTQKWIDAAQHARTLYEETGDNRAALDLMAALVKNGCFTGG